MGGPPKPTYGVPMIAHPRLRPLFALALASTVALGCTASGPEGGTPSPAFTPQQTAGPSSTSTPSPLPSPTLEDGGVRACAYVPGAPTAEMPEEVLAGPTPTPRPSPSTPPRTIVDAATTTRQLGLLEAVRNAVREQYVDPDLNGRDWDAITGRYEALVRTGLTDDDFYTAVKGMIAELGDEHSSFDSPADVKASAAELAGQNDYAGVGAQVLPLPEAGRAVILLVFPGSPAAEAGLRAHDSIVAADGQPILDEEGVLRRELLRGPEGSRVTLSIQRPGAPPFEAHITRARIRGALPIDYCLIRGTRVAYLYLPSLFDQTFPDQVRAALAALTANGPLAGLILDNRMNGGGSSTVLEPVLGLLADGRVGEFRSRQAVRSLVITPEDVGGSQRLPLVVLVGPGTVSFGEILSGVLQARGRARVVGQTTLGNVETLTGYDFADGSRAWIAHETFDPDDATYGPWEETGIVPDVNAPVRWDLFTEADDPALAAALDLLGSQ